jgi:uncharacterized protein YbjT (DUF2867 family)
MENLLMSIPLIVKLGIAGSAVRGDLKFAMIATNDIASIAAEHLVRRDFIGKQVLDLLGACDISLNEAFSIIGQRIGLPDLKYVQFPYDEAAKGMIEMGISEDVSSLFLEMCEALNNGLFAVGRPRTPVNTTLTKIDEFAETFARTFEESAFRNVA